MKTQRTFPPSTMRRIAGFAAGLAATLLLLGGTAAASPLFDGSAARAWVPEASGVVRSYQAPEWLDDVPPGLGGASAILINQMANSKPPMSSALPDVSLIGLSAGVAFDSPAQVVSLQPASGTFDGTVRLRFHITPTTANTTSTLHWKIFRDGADPEDDSLTFSGREPRQHDIFLFDNGHYNVDYWITGSESRSTVTAGPYVITGADPQRDSSGDGIPDVWALEHGLDPFENLLLLDSDGDGWSDFDEILRGSDPNDPNSVPVDSDGDGWSDFDEELRGTDPEDRLDKPRARRLSEVEYLIVGGGAYADAEATQPLDRLTGLEAYDIDWLPLYRQRTLSEEIAALDALEHQMPEYLRPSLVGSRLAAGELPELRLPAGKPVILHTGHRTAGNVVDAWSANAWLESRPDIAPRGAAGWMEDNDRSWSTAQEWQDAYVDYLADNLVQDLDEVVLNPAGSAGVALVEGVIAWLAGLWGLAPAPEDDARIPVLLGSDRGLQPTEAVARLRRLLQADGRDFDDLHRDLLDLTVEHSEVSALYGRLLSLYDGNTNSTTDPVVTTQMARELLRGSVAERYPLALLALRSLESILDLDEGDRLSLWDPLADYDYDGLDNAVELLGSGPAFTRPDNPDSDGDGLEDGLDPCPTDPENLCLLVDDLNLGVDSDGDGIPDALDNCPNVYNPDQADSDGYALDGRPDGIGDACAAELLAVIVRPGADLTVGVGSRVSFAARPTEKAALAGIELPFYDWDFGGAVAANDSVQEPGEVLFDQPGTYEVVLTVSGFGADATTDSRTITVVDGPVAALPVLSARGEEIEEGDSGQRTGFFYLSLDRTVSHAVRVNYRLVDGTATAGEDYLADSGTVTIPPGQRHALIGVTVLGDTKHEPDEDVLLELSEPVGAQISEEQARLVILNDDEPGGAAGPLYVAIVPNLLDRVPEEGDLDAPIAVEDLPACLRRSLDLGGTEVVPGDPDPGGVGISAAGAPETSGGAEEIILRCFEGETVSLLLGLVDSLENGAPPVTTDTAVVVHLRYEGTVDLNPGVDYSVEPRQAGEGAVGIVTIPAGESFAAVSLSFMRDQEVEGDEILDIKLDSVGDDVAEIHPVVGQLKINVLDLPPLPLNDTGVAFCANAEDSNLPCPQNAAPGQDAEFGRDVTHPEDGDGLLGFSFTKLDINGTGLPAGALDFACVRDEVTGLVWQVADEHARGQEFAWYDSDPATNGNYSGALEPPEWSEGCRDMDGCNTEAYVAHVNSNKLCGFDDWRLPRRHELFSLMNFGEPVPGQASAVDARYFPNLEQGADGWASYWTADTVPDRTDWAYAVLFNKHDNLDVLGTMSAMSWNKADGAQVMLVRSGEE